MMQNVMLGSLWPVSRLVLGGGGLGQLWGTTSREEAVATVHAAVAGGITLFDLAPLYGRGEAEAVIGEAFAGRPAPELRFTTKCQLGNVPAEAVAPRVTVPVPQFEPGVVVAMEGTALTVAVTAVRAAEGQPAGLSASA